MRRLLAACLLVIGISLCGASGCAGGPQPSEVCEGITVDDENMLRASIEKAQDDGFTFEETLDRLRTLCPEGSQDCDQCVTTLAEEIFGETETP